MTFTKRKRVTGSDLLAIISALGIMGWLASDFFGGMILFLITLSPVIILFVLFYFISFIETLITVVKKGKRASKVKIIAHSAVIFSIAILNIYHSDLLRSERVMTAILKDDLLHYRLIFRKNGNVENHIQGIFGFTEIHYGKYQTQDGLIVFLKKPYPNNFLPDTVLLDEKQGAIFITKDRTGSFETDKRWLNHFEIE